MYQEHAFYRGYRTTVVEHANGHRAFNISDPDGRPVAWSFQTEGEARQRIDQIVDGVGRERRPER